MNAYLKKQDISESTAKAFFDSQVRYFTIQFLELKNVPKDSPVRSSDGNCSLNPSNMNVTQATQDT